MNVIYFNTPLTRELFGLEVSIQTKTLLIPSTELKLTFDTMPRNQLNQKLKLMVEAPRYAIY